MTVDSWDWSPTVPTVSGVALTSSPSSPVQGLISGGTEWEVTISGSGFVPGSTVDFVEESSGTPTVDNVILPATNVSVVSSTSITADPPAVVEGSTYFVTVTTPGGTNAYIPYPSTSDVFTYVAVAPSNVSIASGGTGSISGATEVTIDGTGFVDGSTVNFVPENSSVTGATTLPGTSVTVVSGNEMTAFSPVGAVEPNYYVTVTTPTGTSATTSNAVFTYTPLTPVVGNLTYTEPSPSTGGYFTITGVGFLSDATVTLVAETNGTTGASYAATGITVTGYTTIEADAPAVPTGHGATTTFYVIVTTTWGSTSYPSSTPSPIFSYS